MPTVLKTSDLSIRTMSFEVRDFKVSEDGKRARFRGYGNVFNAINPYFNERTLPGAYAKTLQEGGRNVPLCCSWSMSAGHAGHAGYIEDAGEDQYGLWILPALNLETQAGREGAALVEQAFEVGRPMGISREFRAIKEQTGSDGVREILEEALYGMSLTPYPSMPTAMITDARDALAFLRSFGINLSPDQEALALASMSRAAGLAPAEPGTAHSADDLAPLADALESVLATLRAA